SFHRAFRFGDGSGRVVALGCHFLGPPRLHKSRALAAFSPHSFLGEFVRHPEFRGHSYHRCKWRLDGFIPNRSRWVAVVPFSISFLGIARTVWGNANDPFSAAMTGAALIAIGLAALTAMVAYIVSFRRSFLRLPELADAGPIRRLSRCFSPLTFFHNLAPRSSSPRACCQFVARSLLRSTAHLQTLLCSLAVGLVVSAESLSSASLHFSVESNTSPPME